MPAYVLSAALVVAREVEGPARVHDAAADRVAGLRARPAAVRR